MDLSAGVAGRLMALLEANRGAANGCDGGDGVVVRLRYRRGVVRSFAAAGCQPERLWSDSRVETLRGTAAGVVGGLFALPVSPGGHVVLEPAVIDQPLAAATKAGETGWTVSVEELLDPRVPLGTVVWQSPLPRSPTDPGVGGVDILVAVPPAAGCRASDLRGAYWDGGNGTGNHFGNVAVIDRSNAPCALAGRLTLAGLDRAGRIVTGPASEPVRRLMLSPRARVSQLPPHQDAGLFAIFGFSGAAYGLCGDVHRQVTVPSTWRLRIGSAVVQFPNVPYVGLPGEKGGPFYSCEARSGSASARAPIW